MDPPSSYEKKPQWHPPSSIETKPPPKETKPQWRILPLLAAFLLTAPLAQYMSITRLTQETISPPSSNSPPNLLNLALVEKQQRQIQMARDLLLVTPLGNSTADNKGVHALKCSMTSKGHNPEHLVQSKFDDSQGYVGLDIKKITAISKTLQELSLKKPATTLILVVDAFDVVIQGTPEEIIHAYDSQPYPILFGSETACWNAATKTSKNNASTPLCTHPILQRSIVNGRYLNSGIFMSTLGTLVRFFGDVLEELPSEREGLEPQQGQPGQFYDQAYWGYWYTKYHPLIGLEVRDELIVNMDRRLRKGLAFDKKTGLLFVGNQAPPIMHFPGSHPKLFNPYVDAKQYYNELC
ncbi:expressed unknown protein [Seminavis robusta]|uniref:PLOD1-3-like GT domain-containing protein n=1 Tax=Seminavis robusta TaxID=568900 RepID=A0A9N8DLK5_9STRA|nr:expressed unknown protein [Seminavis robusta]|eukprot:Sro199_g084370.1 n/a (352) ;mRNA; r:41989-43250